MQQPLGELLPGSEGIITALQRNEAACIGLRRLGLTEGTRIRCIRRCPLRGPVLYLVRGATLAIRREDAERILVRKI